MKRYNQMISYLNLNMRYNRVPLLVVLLVMAGSQLALFYNYLAGMTFEASINSNITPWAPRFETILSANYFSQIYYVFFFLVFIFIATIPIRQNMNSKGRLTLLRLPLKRSTQFGLQVFSSILSLFFVFVVELITILIAFKLYQHMVPVELQMNNALFLAVLRSGFLRELLPITNLAYFTYLLFFFVGISFSAAYLGLCLQTKHGYGKVIATILLFLVGTNMEMETEIGNLFFSVCLALLLWSMIHKLKLYLYEETNA